MPALRPKVQAFLDETRRFVYDALIPAEDGIEETDEVPDALLTEVARRGYFGMATPREYGGLGLSLVETCLILTEIHKAPTAIGNMVDLNNGIGALPLIYDGTPEQKARYLPRIATGTLMAAFALSEPEAGSDAQNLHTRAERKNGRWVLNGRKFWITNARRADLFMVAAANDPQKRAKGGITVFLVEKGTPGLTVTRKQPMMGNRGIDESEVVLENCAVPDENVIGEVGYGFRTLMKTLDNGRVKCCAIAIGYAERALEHALAFARHRRAFGRPIAEYQGIQWKLADAATACHVARLVMLDAAAKIDRGLSIPRESAMAKLHVTEALQPVVDECLQILGARGYCRDWPLERLYRNYRQVRIVEGTSEIMRNVIARSLLRDGL